MNLVEILLQQAKHRGDHPAIIETRSGKDDEITFAQLQERTARAAGMFSEAGLTAQDRVLLLVPMSIELYVALLGLWRLGVTVVVVDPGAGLAHVRRCCEAAKPTGLVGVPMAQWLSWLIPPLRWVKHSWVIGRKVMGRSFERYRTIPPLHDIAAVSDDASALLTFTSGSTGQPKAAVRTHGFLRAQYEALFDAMALEPGEIDLATLPIFALSNLAAGVTTLIPDADLRRVGEVNTGRLMQQIHRCKPTRSTASPAFFQRLIKAAPLLPMFTKIYTGGAPVFASLMDRLEILCPHARLIAVYGSTEAEPIAELDWSTVTETDRKRMKDGGGLPTGAIVGRIDLRIIADRWGEPIGTLTPEQLKQVCLPVGQTGEIIVAGEHVLPGYLDGQGDELVKLRVDDRVWHRTGDAGYLDEQGRLWLMGRASAKISDERGTLYPFAVECAADDVPHIQHTALVCHDNARLLVAQSATGDTEELVEFLSHRLAWAKLDAIMFVDRIPLDRRHNAKVDYPALMGMIEQTSNSDWHSVRQST